MMMSMSALVVPLIASYSPAGAIPRHRGFSESSKIQLPGQMLPAQGMNGSPRPKRSICIVAQMVTV